MNFSKPVPAEKPTDCRCQPGDQNCVAANKNAIKGHLHSRCHTCYYRPFVKLKVLKVKG